MSLVQMSFYGAVMTLVVIVLRFFLINKLPKKSFLILWGSVLVRLLLPFSFPSALSIYSAVEPSRIAPETVRQTPVGNLFMIPSAQESVTGIPSQPPEVFSIPVWPLVWVSGFLLCTAVFVFLYIKSHREFRTSLPIQNAFLENWLQTHRRKRPIAIRQSDRIAAPLTYGILRPVILLPKTMKPEDSPTLQYVLEHEYVHIRHFDAAIKLLLAAVLCIHWFNPLVWVMYLLINRDMEMACDEAVIHTFGEKERAAYARTLIRMEESKSRLLELGSHFSKNAAEERIKAIMKYKKVTVAGIVLCGILAVAVAVGFATSAPQTDIPAQKQSQLENLSQPGMQSRPENQLQSEKPDASQTIDPVSAEPASIVYESVDILYYENGWPYLQDVITNLTGKAIATTTYCMLAYDKNGAPLKLNWYLADTDAESSYDYLVEERKREILPNHTDDGDGGWTLYDGEKMPDWPKRGDGGPNKVAYSLFCMKQVVFADGSTWENPDYESWLAMYIGKEVNVSALKEYYPHTYHVTAA